MASSRPDSRLQTPNSEQPRPAAELPRCAAAATRRTFLQRSAAALALGALPAAITHAATTPTSPATPARPVTPTLTPNSTSHPSRAPRLIVRGDDMGFSHSGNEALIQCHVDGIETSIEVLAPAPWFPEAVRLLAQHPTVDVGVHLALTSEWDNVKWRPLTPCRSLVDADGYFFPMVRPNPNYPRRSIVEQTWQLDDIEREFRAQIERVRQHVPRVSHVSAHMGCTTLSPQVAALTRRLTQEYGIDIDLDELGVKRISYAGPKRTGEEKLTSFLGALAQLQPGGTYWFIDHPGLDTPELRAISHIGYTDVAVDRQGVTSTWTHPQVKTAIRERGIELIGYNALKR